MRTIGLNSAIDKERALARYDHLREQGLEHADAVQHAAIYYGILNPVMEALIRERDARNG